MWCRNNKLISLWANISVAARYGAKTDVSSFIDGIYFGHYTTYKTLIRNIAPFRDDLKNNKIIYTNKCR